MSYALSKISDHDYDFLWQLNEETLRDHIEVIWGWDEKTQRVHFHDRLKRNTDKKLILIHDLRVGCLELSETDEMIDIVNIQILSKHQGKGLGGRVVLDLIDQATSKGLDVKLEVFKVNTRALYFYQKMNFQIVGSTETHWHLRWSHNEHQNNS